MTQQDWALYLGCVIPNRLPYMELAIRETLQYFDISTQDIKGFSCCPNPLTLPHIDQQAALAIAARNLAVAEKAQLPILTPCHGCFETLKGAAVRLKADKNLLTDINKILATTGYEYHGTTEVKHFVQFLFEDIGPAAIAEAVVHPLTKLRAAIHVGCHILRPSNLLKVDDAQRPTLMHLMVRALGIETIHYQDEMDCCGYGTRPADRELSLTMTGNKLTNIKQAGADALIVICPACTIQFDLLQRLALRQTENRTPVPVFYYPELLSLALGTPSTRLGFDMHRVKVDEILAKILPATKPMVALIQ